ncbi:MAG: PorP/SprF family type IX secretion system membrane protein [Saprospiraceae bacterium]|nr:PorP/SprF family type IX secretion system membrane protein [Saprospiraceae bacterium]
MLRKLLIAVLGFVMLGNILAQDIHQSQFYTSPLNLNPALTGNFFGDQRFALNYRNQWFVDDLVKYLTFTGSYDLRLFPKKWTQRGIWSLGFLVNYDKAGDSRLGLTHLGVSASFAYPINNKNIFSLGAMIGGTSRRFSVDNLTWDEQYNNGSYDPNRPSGENIGSSSNFFMDVSAGLNYRWQKSKRTKLDLGLGAYHLNKPDQIFYSSNQTIQLPYRFTIYALPSLNLSKRFDLLFHVLYQNQRPYEEIVYGGYLRSYLSRQRGREFNVLLGIAVRNADALIPKVAFEYKNWYLGVSYDINNSDFKKATNRRGGPEFSLIHVFVKARPIEVLRTCPIF